MVPSGRKRNTPSMPAKPDGVGQHLLRRSAAAPCVFTSAATSDDRVIGERGGAHRVAAEARAVAAGEVAEAGRRRARRYQPPCSAALGEDARIVPQAGAEQLHALEVRRRPRPAPAPPAARVGAVRNEQRIGLRQRRARRAAPAACMRSAPGRDSARARRCGRRGARPPAGTPPRPPCRRRCPASARRRIACRARRRNRRCGRRRTPAGSSGDRRRAPRRWRRSRTRSPARCAPRATCPAGCDRLREQRPRMISAPSSSACCAAGCAPGGVAAVVLHQQLDVRRR